MVAVRLGLVLAAGVATGVIGRWAYYDSEFRVFAHLLGPWILLCVLVSARRGRSWAIAASVAALTGAVVAFYGTSPHGVDVDRLLLWCGLAVVGGAALGWAFHRIGTTGLPAALSSAGAIGLLVGDALVRVESYGVESALLPVFLVLAVGLVLARSAAQAQWPRIVLLAVPAVAVGYALVSIPDVLEQVVLIGL